jgi:hypothetical protein
MKEHQLKKLGISIELPEGWKKIRAVSSPGNRAVAFKGPSESDVSRVSTQTIHILAGPLGFGEAVPSMEDTKRYFRQYVAAHHYTGATDGVVRLGPHKFFWGQYHMPAGLVARKYSLVLGRVEYVITITFGSGKGDISDRELRRRERLYDEILSTFRPLASAKRPRPRVRPAGPALRRFLVGNLGLLILDYAAWAGWIVPQVPGEEREHEVGTTALVFLIIWSVVLAACTYVWGVQAWRQRHRVLPGLVVAVCWLSFIGMLIWKGFFG